MSELARRSVEAGTATITLDSPANRNALSRQLRRDLLDALHATEEDDSPGGGARPHRQRLLCGDIAIAVEEATFAFPEVRIGIVPAVISVTVLPRVMPRAAHELFLTGETFDAQRAVAIGLLNAAVPAAELDAEVARYTGMLAKGGPEALALTKQMLRRAPAPTMAEDFAAMLEISAARFASDEGQEGIRAFAEKRPPSWMPSDG